MNYKKINPAPFFESLSQIKKDFVSNLLHFKNKFYVTKKRCGVNLIILTALLTINFSLITITQASTFDQIFGGFKNTGVNAGYQTTGTGAPKYEFNVAWAKYANGLLNIIAVLFLIFVIYGGWLWMTAHGNEEQVAKAKKMIVQSVVAIGIIFFARLMVEFILYWLGESTTNSG
ncbi:MAG: hypothetical protein A3J62_01145 [Candidatus Buchananbacteria bacterium RIFCSPHIGHO2_02_FULL_38_8]|uniref:Uncharacterized protein n=2 Tax=Candidatus Buchananiibacteriota TaxID=1817903 RepID=A0A1G1XYJ8_9BACT|nr:MAG: hypothetical protein A2731_03125 [Candidatus Buchananbacteria bacterium RIFCSPHIGHO2_01_FULL_39_8]OGY47548.1 MAG: hypothetical protein A3J62_01145 [Candidatus Buchananbacteria bacterium RIFCSPHIGHO2_02_FULL_38_8]